MTLRQIFGKPESQSDLISTISKKLFCGAVRCRFGGNARFANHVACGFFDLGRPICILQEAPTLSAVVVTVVIEIAFAVASLVLAFAALLGLRDGVLSAKLFLLVLLAPFLSGLLVYHAVRLVFFPLRVWLFTEGLVRARGIRMSTQRWDRIASVSVQALQGHTSTHYTLTVEGRNGARLEFGKGVVDLSSHDLQRLVNVLSAHENLSLLVALQKIEKGAAIEFGPLHLSRQGIVHAAKTLPWNEVGDIRFEEGQVVIFRQDQCWCAVATMSIPNPALFERLAERYFPSAQPAAAASE